MAVVKIKDANGNWQNVVALKGDKGEDGTDGITPNLTVQVETLAAGSNATVTQSGTAENPVIKLGIPRGNTGATGANGTNGKDADTSTLVLRSGSRGSLAGYETSGTNTTINASAPDSNQTGSNITVQNGSSGTSWTKVVRVTSAVSVTLGSSWKWVGGSAPTIKSGGILVCCWCGSGGIANFISPS